MPPSLLRVLVGAALLSIVSVAHADVELKNDGFVSGGAANFQTGFVAGEAGASRFVASTTGRQLKKLQLLFGGGAATTQTLTLRVFDDTAGTDVPGAELFMGDFQLTGSDSAIQELDLTSSNVIVTAQFRVAIEFQHAGAPTIASDGDGTVAADKNFINAAGAGWKKSNTLGIAGDWVIRAFLDDPPPPNPNVFCDTTPECPGGQICDVPHHACIDGCRTTSECSAGTCDSSGQCVPTTGDHGGCATGGGGGVVFGLGSLGVLVVSRRRR
jgi:uncharacterized protein (TIGR03382 family)